MKLNVNDKVQFTVKQRLYQGHITDIDALYITVKTESAGTFWFADPARYNLKVIE